MKPKSHLHLTVIFIIVILTCPFILPTVQPAQAATTLYVKPKGTGNCSNWDNACDLNTALIAASPYSEIWAATGVYTPTQTTNPSEPRSATFQLKSNVALYGCFAGTGTDPNFRDCTSNITVLSGDLDGNDITDPSTGVVTTTENITGTNAYHVVTGSGVTETAVLDGFIITAGKTTGSGAGMFNSYGNPTLNDIIFSGNLASDGGGIYNRGSSPSLTNVTFIRNTATNSGGGMYNNGGSPKLTNVTFISNSANNGGGIHIAESTLALDHVNFNDNSARNWGGGMHIYHTNVTLINVNFNNNSANNGGGISTTESTLELEYVNFDGNTATDYGGGMCNNNITHQTLTNVTFRTNSANNGEGGAIYNNNSHPKLNNATFSNNSASSSGGGMYNYSSNPTLINVFFNGNTASEHGGGIRNTNNSSPTLTNIVFNDNSATYEGGGMHNSNNSNPKLTNVTFSDNKALGGGGGGMRNEETSPTLVNCILSGNSGNPGSQIYDTGNTSISYSLINGGCPTESTCDHLINANPQFVDAANGNLHLQNTSPAIDAGDNSAPWLSDIVTDLDGNPRFIEAPDVPNTGNGTAPIVDMGAYEYAPPLPSITSLKADPNPSSFGQSVNFTATVTATSGIPSGSVSFYEEETFLGTSNLNEGIAIFITATLSSGTHTINAHYSGDTGFLPSISAPLNQIVKAGSMITLTAHPNPAQLGQVVIFTASVSAADDTSEEAPTGEVIFYDGETLLGRNTLNEGIATFSTSELSIGTHIITAYYSGNTNFTPSTSDIYNQVVNPQNLYLPLILKNCQAYFDGPWEQEPNNNPDQANGPLCFGQIYSAHPNDIDDYYFFYLPEASTLTVKVNDHNGENVQILLYHPFPSVDNLKVQIYEKPYQIKYNGAAGWYYIRIYATGNYNYDQPYTLEVDIDARSKNTASIDK